MASRTRTLTNLILDCRQRAGMENSTLCTDAEVTEYLNQELAELYNCLIQIEDHPYLRSSQAYTVTSSTSSQALPSGFLKVQEVEAVINGVTGVLHPFTAMERAILVNSGTIGYDRYVHPVQYRIQAGNIEFLPTGAFTATLFYTPAQTRLSSGSDTFDGYNGYEMAAIYGTVMTMLAKEESDVSFYGAQKDRIYGLINSWAANRDMSHAPRVTEVIPLVDYDRF